MSATLMCQKHMKVLPLFMSSCSTQRLANFMSLPAISQQSFANRSRCFLYLVRNTPVCTSLNGCFRFSYILSKEVIHQLLPILLPCYDFTPIIGPTFCGWLLIRLPHRLRVLLSLVV